MCACAPSVCIIQLAGLHQPIVTIVAFMHLCIRFCRHGGGLQVWVWKARAFRESHHGRVEEKHLLEGGGNLLGGSQGRWAV